MKTRSAVATSSSKSFLKTPFLDVYRSDNYIACYNFYKQSKDYFATAKVKRANYIFFAVFFF